MIIVIEGPDNSGKSTLATTLAKRLKGIYLKSEMVPATQLTLSGFHEIALIADELYPFVICDRHPFISETIYSKVLGRGTSLEIRMDWLPVDGKVIFCCPPTAMVVNSIHEREQLDGVVGNINQLITEYAGCYNYLRKHHPDTVCSYDFVFDSLDSLISWIKLS